MFKWLFSWLFGKKKKEQQQTGCCGGGAARPTVSRSEYTTRQSVNEALKEHSKPSDYQVNYSSEPAPEPYPERRRNNDDMIDAVVAGAIALDIIDSFRSDDSGSYSSGSDYSSSSDSSSSMDFGGGDGGGGGASGDW